MGQSPCLEHLRLWRILLRVISTVSLEMIHRKLSEDLLQVAEGQWILVEVTGSDAAGFLHGITTNDIHGLESGGGNQQALLNKRSQVEVHFFAFRSHSGFLLLVEQHYSKRLLDLLEQYHFAEDVSIRESTMQLWQLHGAKAAELLRRETGFENDFLLSGPAMQTYRNSLVFSLPVTGEPGYLIQQNGALESLRANVEQAPEKQWQTAFDSLALEAGYPRLGVDFDSTNLVLELDSGSMLVSTTKGCFPGQEVVARVVSRGKIPRKLRALIFDPQSAPGMEKENEAITIDGKNAGLLRRMYHSPSQHSPVGVAFIKADIADTPGDYSMEIQGKSCSARLQRLPLHQGEAFITYRDTLYSDGMAEYHSDRFEAASALFRRALKIDRHHAGSWEAMAMAVEKQGDHDEAIRLNMRYLRADPLAVMAHTNLSRLYMLKGFKEKAEEEQGKAALAEMKLSAARDGGGLDKQEMVRRQQEQQDQELKRKSEMFRQVLEMDPDDEIANFGMGKLMLESGQAESAITHLRKVTDQNPGYSAAWHLLARALLTAGRLKETRQTLEDGIEAARRQGDMMPEKAMRQMLSLL